MKIPSPALNAENKAFFDAARAHKLMVGRCKSCKQLHYYPRAICPFCSGEAELAEVRGKGTIYSYSVMRRVPQPYAIAYVALEEGVTMLTNLVDCDLDRIRIGDPVRVVFKAAEGGEMIPMFAPA